MGPRRSRTGRLGTPGSLNTPEMAPMGGTPPKIISNSNVYSEHPTTEVLFLTGAIQLDTFMILPVEGEGAK